MGIYDPENSIMTHICREEDALRKEQIHEIQKTKGWTYSRAKRFVLKLEQRKMQKG